MRRHKWSMTGLGTVDYSAWNENENHWGPICSVCGLHFCWACLNLDGRIAVLGSECEGTGEYLPFLRTAYDEPWEVMQKRIVDMIATESGRRVHG
jgi:hypothetical protein